MNVVNGFLPTETLDRDSDGQITYEEFAYKLQPINIDKKFDTNNIVAEKNYETNNVWFHREKSTNPATFLWFCMSPAENAPITCQQYNDFVATIHEYIEFNDNWVINVKNLRLPNLKRALENFSKQHVRLEGHALA